MIDIHSHILSGIDDGSKDMEMSLNIARIYVENGINKVIATPHHIEGAKNPLTEDIMIKIEELKKELFRVGIPLEIYPGNEVFVSSDIFRDITENKILTLNNSRYILMELPMREIPLYTEDLIYNLLIKGFVPIIAHPERYAKVIEDPNILYRYIKLGALAQGNILSLEGFYGAKIKHTAELLLKHKMYHFIATDTHSDGHRSPNIEKPLSRLKELTNNEYFKSLTETNAQLIIDNMIIPKHESNEVKKKPYLIKGLETLLSKY